MKRAAVLTACLGMLAGCSSLSGIPSPVPQASYLPAGAGQPVVASAAHWQIIARDAAGEIIPRLTHGASAAVLPARPGSGVFGDAFYGMLRTRLVDAGVALAPPGTAAQTVSFSVLEISHARGPLPAPGRLTLLGAAAGTAVWALQAGGPAAAAAPFIGGAAGVLLDARSAVMPDAPAAEIVVTVSLKQGGREKWRFERVYYVSPADASEYSSRTARQACRPVLMQDYGSGGIRRLCMPWLPKDAAHPALPW